MLYIISGLIALFVLAEASSFIFKIRSQKYYSLFHFLGGALIYLLFSNLTRNRLLALLSVLVVGILWEIHEWLLWKYFFKKKVYKPEGKDTWDDLLMDILGALFFYVIQIIRQD